MSTEEEQFQIKVRRHPVFSLIFLAIGGGLIGVGFYFDQYGFMILGGMTLIPGVFAYMNPALIITPDSVQLKNLLGYTGRVIPHDGFRKLSVREGKLVIEYGGRRAELPRPNAKALHRADWNFMVEALEKARSLGK